ncbi:unnamed protein product [Cylicocyclus nassatus]|uniref:Uncharacterized protein n=1 Tax=Cylicocyclus nassatus TaxID=53992 RepID=A0AA36HC81_CYLNA|nr:unnamed protein product [Cylicocyclus nassatus]
MVTLDLQMCMRSRLPVFPFQNEMFQRSRISQQYDATIFYQSLQLNLPRDCQTT